MDERDDVKFEQVIGVLKQYEGNIPVKIKLEGKVFAMDGCVRQCTGLQYELNLILGEKNVVFFEK